MKSIPKVVFYCSSPSPNSVTLLASIKNRSWIVTRTATSSNNNHSEDKSTTALTLPSLCFSTDATVTMNNIATSLTNFKEAKAYYRRKVLEGNRELGHMYTGDQAVKNVFRQIFPELVKSRGITMLQEQDIKGELFSRWEEGKNEVTIELADEANSSKHVEKEVAANNTHLDAVFIGGPSTLTSCLLYKLRYPDHRIQHVCASRHDSNHDGSAFYYHQRDAAPVYINRVNRGPYCIYIDLYKSLIDPKKLVHQAETNRHHVKISLNWANIKLRYIFTIFIPNFWHMVTDLWIKNKRKSKIAHVIQHACRTMSVVHAISDYTGAPVENMIVRGKNKANYVGFTGADSDPKTHFTWLNKFAPIPFDEISCEGFGDEVTQVLNFPSDGVVAPMIIENLQQQIADQTISTQSDATHEISREFFQLKKLFVQPMSSDCSKRMRVTSIEWMDTIKGTTHRMNADRVFISLGPSGQFNIVSPTLTWMQHAMGVARGKFISRPTQVIGGYKPTLRSFWRHTLNSISSRFFRGSKCLKDFFWASGSTSVVLLGVDASKVTPAQLDVFSRYIDGVNQHWTLIAQRDVSLPMTADTESPMKNYRFFAIQMTGGGNFPSRLVRPDFLLNLLYTTEKMYGLDVMKHAVYDLVQARGCGRAVSAQNTISFQNLADNAVISYALGGIGMTTMFANGEKMVQMIEQHDETLKKVNKKMTSSSDLLDGIDYSFMTDENQRLSRFLGFDDSMSMKEKKIVTGSTLVMAFGLILTVSLCHI